MFFLLGCFSLMQGLVAELAMRAAFEHNAGRYWEEARRVNFGPAGAEWPPRVAPDAELRSTVVEESVGR
jgi:hypothetical protein